MKSDDFINVKITVDNIDNFYIRKSIFNCIKKELPGFKGKLLDVGCGKMPYRSYIMTNSQVEEYVGLDVNNAPVYDANIRPDIIWDGIKMPLDNESFNTVFATEVLEHCPNPSMTLGEIYRVLKKRGVLFFTTPFFWPLHESPHDEFRYTPYALERILKSVGFKNIKIYGGGGWHASLAQMLGLWAKRAPLRNWQKKFFTILLKPIIALLAKKDQKIDLAIRDQQMFTNFYGTAEK